VTLTFDLLQLKPRTTSATSMSGGHRLAGGRRLAVGTVSS